MKIRLLVFTLLLSINLSAQRASFFFTTVKPVGEAPTNITDVTVSFKTVQRTDEAIAISASTPALTTSWEWKIYNAKTKVLIATETDEDPSFDAIETPGLYDLRLEAKNSSDTYKYYWEDAFYNHLPKPTEGECDEVWDVSTGGFSGVYSDVSRPGYIIGIKGSGTGDFYTSNLYSDDPDNPVRIVKLDGAKSVISNSSNPHQIFTENGFRNVVWDGYNTDGSRGIRFVVPEASNIAQQVMFRGAYTGLHLTGMEFDHQRDDEGETGVNLGACINFAPWDFSVSPNGAAAGPEVNSTNHIALDMVVFDLLIESARQEGIYFNYNNDGLISGYQPFKARGAVVARNVIKNTGRDAFQGGALLYSRVHDNYCENWGLNQSQSHENGISWNAGNNGCRVYGNYFRNGKMAFNAQSGDTPWDVYAGETSADIVPNKIYCNVFIEGTVPEGGATEPYFWFFQTSEDSGSGSIGWEVFNNTSISPKEFGGAYSHTSSFTIDKLVVVNNIISKGANGASTTIFDYLGGGDAPSGSVQNNLIRSFGSESDLLFTDLANGDVSLSSLSSPALAGSPTDVFESFDYRPYDNQGAPIIAPGYDLPFGAYSAFNMRENDPASDGTLTLTTALSASTITTDGFTVECQPNQQGRLYVAITTGGESNPTNSQIISGLNAAGTMPSKAFVMLNGADGVTSNEVVTGLSGGTAYDVHAAFVNIYGTITSVTKLDDVTTEGDAVAPTVGDFWISSLNRSRLYLDNISEDWDASSVTGFSFSSGKTASSITRVNATKGYFTMSSAYVTGATENITYAGGSDFGDVNGNALEAFGSTAVGNHITSTAEQDVTQGIIQGGSFTGNDFTGTGDNPGGMKTIQAIPVGSDGYIEFQWPNTTGHELGAGLISSATNYTFQFNQPLAWMYFEANSNMSVYQSGAFKDFQGALQVTTNYFRVRRVGATGQVITEYSLNGSSWSEFFNHGNIAASLILYGVVQTAQDDTASGRQVINVRMQAAAGLIVDNE